MASTHLEVKRTVRLRPITLMAATAIFSTFGSCSMIIAGHPHLAFSLLIAAHTPLDVYLLILARHLA